MPHYPLPAHTATMFMEAAQRDKAPMELISLLSQMALATEQTLADQATHALYNHIVLPLCDDFSTSGVSLANQVLATMIFAFSKTRQGKEMAQLLDRLHLDDEISLLERYQQLCQPRPITTLARKQVKKVFILSRVTLGADIAINSLIARRVRQAMPTAEICMVGPDHLPLLFAGQGIHHLHFPYQRAGSFAQRLNAWPRLFQLVEQESADLRPEEILVFDPDTRLSQLGLLPLTDDAATCYLPSRLDVEAELSLAEITNNWLDQILPGTPPSQPQTWLASQSTELCRKFLDYLPASTFRVAINLGVGNDNNKRLGDLFEEELITGLLALDNTLVILDSGKGQKEEELAKRLLAKTAKKGYKTAEISHEELAGAHIPIRSGLLRFSGPIDTTAGMIMAADLFIGYDSCCQHLATTTKTPAIVCFTGAPNKRFVKRWQPGNHHGKTTTLVIDKNNLYDNKRQHLLAQIINAAHSYRALKG